MIHYDMQQCMFGPVEWMGEKIPLREMEKDSGAGVACEDM